MVERKTVKSKKLFWIKLQYDFFKEIRLKKLRKIAGGDTYTIIYLKLLLLSLSNSGFLSFEKVDETFLKELALKIDEEEDDISVALQYLKSVGLLEVYSEDEFFLTEFPNMVGFETLEALKKRKYRAKEQQENILKRDNVPQMSPICPENVPQMSPICPENVPQMSPICPENVPQMSPICPENVPLDIDIDIDIDKDLESSLHSLSFAELEKKSEEISSVATAPDEKATAKKEKNIKISSEPVFGQIRLLGGEMADIPLSLVEEYKALYTTFDVEFEIRRAIQWCKTNPKKSPKKDWMRFLNSWLTGEHNKAIARQAREQSYQGQIQQQSGKNKYVPRFRDAEHDKEKGGYVEV